MTCWLFDCSGEPHLALLFAAVLFALTALTTASFKLCKKQIGALAR
jgi:hypothetical protein